MNLLLRWQCPLYVVPELEAYRWGADAVRLGLAGSVQRKNAALALQLSRAVLQRHRSTQTQLGNQRHTPPTHQRSERTRQIRNYQRNSIQ